MGRKTHPRGIRLYVKETGKHYFVPEERLAGFEVASDDVAGQMLHPSRPQGSGQAPDLLTCSPEERPIAWQWTGWEAIGKDRGAAPR